MAFSDVIPEVLSQFKGSGSTQQKEMLLNILEGIFVKKNGEGTPIVDIKLTLARSIEEGIDPLEKLREFFQSSVEVWRRNISAQQKENILVDEEDIELFESTVRDWLQENEVKIRERATILAREYGYRPPHEGQIS